MINTFENLHEKHKGKISDKWSLYLREWDQIFASYRNDPVRLLEIGIQNGGSLEVWSEYFPSAKKILGCDIEEKCRELQYDDSRISVVIGDANSDECEKEILGQMPEFDVLIDDGSHESKDIIRSFARYFPYLNDNGGVYIAEDLHCSYWKHFEGGLHNPYSSISFFKRLADMVNYEHWRGNMPRKHLLEKFSEHLNIDFNELDLARIHSVEFVNSLCIIKKLSPEKNVLGERIIAGNEEKVTTEWHKLNNTSINDIVMESGYEAKLDVFNLINEVENLTKDVDLLSQTMTERNDTIANLNQITSAQEEQIANLLVTTDEYSKQIKDLSDSLATHKQQLAQHKHLLVEREKQISKYHESAITQKEIINKYEQNVITHEEQMTEYRANSIARQEEMLRAFHNTRTWRMTQPFRFTAKIVRRFRDKVLSHSERSTTETSNPSEDPEPETAIHAVDKTINSNSDQILMQYLIDSASKPAVKTQLLTTNNITVIIPVYRGAFETERCIQSVLNSTNEANYKLLVINDCSPEPEMNTMLQTLKGSNIEVLHNTENLGFVGTVNKGMKYAGDSDVILLNSDTIVSNNWIDRITNQAYLKESIGTVTPFSNNATICNYPNLDGWSVLPDDENLHQIDLAFSSANPKENIEIPTAVGFCMFIKRDCLDDVGLFDEEAFGKGYGEENDFCLKASQKGWKHILAADTFVFHEGEVSFSTEASSKKANAMDIIRARYPNYENEVISHIRQNQAYKYRVAATAARYRLGDKPVVMFVTHGLGGGTEKHIQELSQALMDSGARILILRLGAENNVILQAFNTSDRLELSLDSSNLKFLGETLKTLGIKKAHIHHTIGFGFSLEELLVSMKLPYDFTVHDHFSICPRIYLIRPNYGYCGVPTADVCNSCLASEPQLAAHSDIYWWRLRFGSLLNGAERVICPSQDTADRIAKIYPSAPILVVPHQGLGSTSTLHINPAKKKRRFAVLGVLGEHKGLNILEKLLQEITFNGLEIEIILIGYTDRPSNFTENFFQTGSYQDKDIYYLIDNYSPDAILFLSQCPETYSYTLTAAIQSGKPIIAPNIGAFPERLQKLSNAHIFPLEFSELELANYLNSLELSEDDPNEKRNVIISPTINEFYQSEDYWKSTGKESIPTLLLIPEMLGSIPSPCAYIRLIQPLMSYDIQKNFRLRISNLTAAPDIQADIIVTNRLPCKELSELEPLLSHAQQTKAKLIYDIDDNLLQLHDSHPEKLHYESLKPVVLKLLKEADCVWTSTPKLAAHLEPLSREVVVIENYLDKSLLEKNNRKYLSDSKFEVLYMGTISHKNDLAQVLVALRKLISRGFEIELNLIGIKDAKVSEKWIKELIPPADAYNYPNFMRWLRSLEHFDLGIAPLESSIFNDCKSDIKFWDYTAMGVPILASNLGAYSSSINNGINGLITESSTDEWVAKITWAINNRDHLSEIVENAANDLTALSIKYSAENKHQLTLLKLIEN